MPATHARTTVRVTALRATAYLLRPQSERLRHADRSGGHDRRQRHRQSDRRRPWESALVGLQEQEPGYGAADQPADVAADRDPAEDEAERQVEEDQAADAGLERVDPACAQL